jgi:hypothetical protein
MIKRERIRFQRIWVTTRVEFVRPHTPDRRVFLSEVRNREEISLKATWRSSASFIFLFFKLFCFATANKISLRSRFVYSCCCSFLFLISGETVVDHGTIIEPVRKWVELCAFSLEMSSSQSSSWNNRVSLRCSKWRNYSLYLLWPSLFPFWLLFAFISITV